MAIKSIKYLSVRSFRLNDNGVAVAIDGTTPENCASKVGRHRCACPSAQILAAVKLELAFFGRGSRNSWLGVNPGKLYGIMTSTRSRFAIQFGQTKKPHLL